MLSVSITVALVVLTALSGSFILMRSELNGALDAELRRAATGVQLTVNRDGWAAPSTQCIYEAAPACTQIVSADGTTDGVLPVTAIIADVASGDEAAQFFDVTVDEAPARAYVTGIDGGEAVLVALRTDGMQRSLQRLALLFSGAAAAGVLLSGALGYGVTHGVLRPVRRLTHAAELVASERIFDQRIPDGGSDELGRLSRSFNAMLRALDRSERVREQLVADASHELRTPLTSIRMNAQLLRDNRLSGDRRQALTRDLVDGVDEMTRLIADVVDVARGDEHTDSFARIDVGEIVRQQTALAGRHWPSVRFELHAEPAFVYGSADAVARMVSNLLDNAAKFSPSQATVDVRCEQRDALVTLPVFDEGPGIDDTDRARIFDRFYRAPAARALPGSGLGLAMVRQIADAHHAAVTVHPRPTQGSCFRISFPAA